MCISLERVNRCICICKKPSLQLCYLFCRVWALLKSDDEWWRKSHACKSAVNLASEVWGLCLQKTSKNTFSKWCAWIWQEFGPLSFLSFQKVKTSLGTNGADKAYPSQCITRTQILMLRYKDTTQIWCKSISGMRLHSWIHCHLHEVWLKSMPRWDCKNEVPHASVPTRCEATLQWVCNNNLSLHNSSDLDHIHLILLSCKLLKAYPCLQTGFLAAGFSKALFWLCQLRSQIRAVELFQEKEHLLL